MTTDRDNNSLLEDIHDINLSYLLLMQRLINSDREQALFRSKINDEMADLLSTISVAELTRLARCDQLLCQFALTSSSQLDALLHAASDDHMQQLHAAILMSGQENRESERRKGERRKGERRDDDRRGMTRDGVERRKGDRRKGERRSTPRRARDAVQ